MLKVLKINVFFKGCSYFFDFGTSASNQNNRISCKKVLLVTFAITYYTLTFTENTHVSCLNNSKTAFYCFYSALRLFLWKLPSALEDLC